MVESGSSGSSTGSATSCQSGAAQSWVATALVFALYQALAIAWFGLPLVSDFSHTYIGQPETPDPGAHMWFLSWWPYALSHHINPFITKMVWAPSGYNLTWATSIPLPALVAYPITRVWGLVVSLNVLTLLAPALAAWCAFILIRHVCKSSLPAIIGGYVFGFSPYMLAQLMGHLCLILVFPVPLAVYLVLLRMERRISRIWFVIWLALAGTTLFLCSEEVFAMTVVFGACAMALATLLEHSADRHKIVEVCALTAIALVATGIMLSPFLFYDFFRGSPRQPPYPPLNYESSLLSFLIPSPVLLIGWSSTIASIAHPSGSGWAEDTAYIGIPLLIIIADYGRVKWRTVQGKIMLIMLGLIAVASLGPRLKIRETATIHLPWIIATKLLLLDKAMTGLFMMFAFLAAGLIVALYLTTAPQRLLKCLLAFLVVVSLIPDLPTGWWFARLRTPRFFANGIFRKYLSKGEITLILPYGRLDYSMLWQAQSGMYFRMAGGYVGVNPPEFERWPVLKTLYDEQLWTKDSPLQLEYFLAAHHVKTIILAHQARRIWPALLSGLNLTGLAVEDVTLYQVPPAVLEKYAGITADDASAAIAMEDFTAMVKAANAYWARGLPLAELNPWEASRLGLLPLPAKCGRFDPNNPQWCGDLWLGKYGPTVAVGIIGDYRALSKLIRRYRPAAKEVFFPYPDKLGGSITTNPTGQLVMTFDRKGLEQAVAASAPNRISARKRNDM